VCKFGGDRAICLREEAICAKVYRRTDDGRRAIALAHSWNELKITETVKHGNHGNRDFRQMPWFCQNTVFAVFFGQNAVFFRFYNNILFLFSVSWSLLCDFNTKMFYLRLCYESHCALLPWRHHRNMYFTFFLELVNAPQWQNFTDETLHCMQWWSSMLDVEFYRLYNGIWAHDLMPCFFFRDFYDFHKSLPCFAVIFYCPYEWDIDQRLMSTSSPFAMQ